MWSNQENRVRKQVKNPCEARKIKASQILHKIISTHLLTVLIMRVILQIEQVKRDKRKGIPDVRRTRNDNTADWIVKI
jgi:hypothetical protein